MAIFGQGVLGNVLGAAGTAARAVGNATPQNSPLHVLAYQLGQERGVSEALNSGGGSVVPTQQNAGATTQPTGNTGGTDTTANNTYTGTGSSYDPGLVSAYDNQIGILQNAASRLSGQKSLQEQISGGQFNQAQNRLTDSYGTSKNNLNYQQGQINANKAISLQDLATRGRNALQSFSNQLGAAGAGSSSAVGLGQYALAQQQARAGQDLNRQYGEQQHGVDVGLSGLETGYKNSLTDLDQQRQAKLLEIAQSYQTIAQQIQDQMSTANEARRQALGGINQQAASAVAAQVAALEGQYNTALAGLKDKYSNISVNPNTAAVTNNDQYAQFVNNPAIDATLTPEQQQQQIQAAYVGIDPNKEQQPLYLN